MSFLRTKTLFVLAALGLFSQIAFAQSAADTAAMKQIAAVVATINHYPSDEDFEVLDAIIANSEVSNEVRIMADTVANIEHSANEEGKGAMETIVATGSASEQMKELATIIANFNHTANDSAKEQLAQLFQ